MSHKSHQLFPLIIKTDPDQNNLIANRRVAYENVPKKASETLRKPIKQLIGRCVGKIFHPINRRRTPPNALHFQAAYVERQLDGDGEGTPNSDEQTECIQSMVQDKENEFPSIIESTQAEIPTSKLDLLIKQEPVLFGAEPNLPLSQPTAQYYCSYCKRSFTKKRGLLVHITYTNIHSKNFQVASRKRGHDRQYSEWRLIFKIKLCSFLLNYFSVVISVHLH